MRRDTIRKSILDRDRETRIQIHNTYKSQNLVRYRDTVVVLIRPTHKLGR